MSLTNYYGSDALYVSSLQDGAYITLTQDEQTITVSPDTLLYLLLTHSPSTIEFYMARAQNA